MLTIKFESKSFKDLKKHGDRFRLISNTHHITKYFIFNGYTRPNSRSGNEQSFSPLENNDDDKELLSKHELFWFWFTLKNQDWQIDQCVCVSMWLRSSYENDWFCRESNSFLATDSNTDRSSLSVIAWWAHVGHTSKSLFDRHHFKWNTQIQWNDSRASLHCDHRSSNKRHIYLKKQQMEKKIQQMRREFQQCASATFHSTYFFSVFSFSFHSRYSVEYTHASRVQSVHIK